MKKSLDDIKQYSFIAVDFMNRASIEYHGRKLSFNGRKTGMQYGLMTFLQNLRKRYPKAEIVFLEEGGQSIRRKIYPGYKGRRGSREGAQEFFGAVDSTRTLLVSMGASFVRHLGLEADDLVPYVLSKYGGNRLLATTDRDWWRFVDDTTDVAKGSVVLNLLDVQSTLGYHPSRILVYKALCGDPSDDVSGIWKFPTALAKAVCVGDMCDTPERIIGAVESLGKKTWADRIRASRWVIDRNLQILGTLPVDTKVVVWETNREDLAAFSKITQGLGFKLTVEEV